MELSSCNATRWRWVTEATRREYYQAHELSYRTRERVRYALIPRLTEAGADSVIERLKAGEPPESILARDSLSGMTRGVIRELMEGQPHSYTNLLFQELRAGQSAKEFLGGDKVWAVFHIILHDASRKLSYAESRDLVDQGAENSMAEQLLSEFLARQRRLHRIEAHPERLARINLIDPRDDGNIPSGD